MVVSQVDIQEYKKSTPKIYLVLLPLNIYLLSILSFVKLNIPLYRSRLYQKSMMVLVACKYFPIFLTRFPEILPDSNRSMCQKPVKSNTRAHFCVFTVSYPRHVNKLEKNVWFCACRFEEQKVRFTAAGWTGPCGLSQ